MWRIWTAVHTVIALAALVIAAWLQPWHHQDAAAQKLPPAVAAVIDYQRILRDAAAARSIREQIEARRKAYQEEISKEEQRLHEIDKEFAKQRSVLSPEDFAEKRREFEQDVAEVQRKVQERRRELDRLSAAALNEVKQALIADRHQHRGGTGLQSRPAQFGGAVLRAHDGSDRGGPRQARRPAAAGAAVGAHGSAPLSARLSCRDGAAS